MSTEPFSFKLPISRFDLNLLPAHARNIGTAEFKDAVIAHFVQQYVNKDGSTTIVTVDDEEISVVTFPGDADALEFALSLLQSRRIAEAVPYLESMAKTDPQNVVVLFNLGIAYSELGQFDEAINRLKKAVQLSLVTPTHEPESAWLISAWASLNWHSNQCARQLKPTPQMATASAILAPCYLELAKVKRR